MSRTSILTLVAIAALGTTSLVPAEAAPQVVTRAAPAVSRPVVVARPAPIVRLAPVAKPAVVAQPARVVRPVVTPSVPHVAAPISAPNATTGAVHQNAAVPVLHNAAPATNATNSVAHSLATQAIQPHTAAPLPNAVNMTNQARVENAPISHTFSNASAGAVAQNKVSTLAAGPAAKNSSLSPSATVNTVTSLTNQAKADKAEAKKDIATAKSDTTNANIDFGKVKELTKLGLGQSAAAKTAQAEGTRLQNEAKNLTKDASRLQNDAKVDANAAAKLAGDKTKGSISNAQMITTLNNEAKTDKAEAKKDTKEANSDTTKADKDLGKADALKDEAVALKKKAATALPGSALRVEDLLKAQADDKAAGNLDKDAKNEKTAAKKLTKEANTLKKDAKADKAAAKALAADSQSKGDN